jgi:hypothetical protein
VVLSIIFSDLASPAEALTGAKSGSQGFTQAGKRYPLFGIMLEGKVFTPHLL